jgi:hypothetical protein
MSEPGDSAETGPELVRELRAIIERQRQELALHQSELSQTNAGLMALHADVDRQRERASFLDEVSRTVSSSLRGPEVIDALVGLVENSEVADTATVWPVPDDFQPAAPHPEEIADDAVRHAMNTHQPVVLGERLLVPLTAGPNLLGVLDLRRDGRPFTADEDPFLRAVAIRAAVGLRNAGEYERERYLAERLQRAMLPTPNIPASLELCARYRPAQRGVNVGGDWFDAFTRPDGTVVLTVGDVTGHGLDAAVIMAKLQNALHAYALEGHGPADALHLTHTVLSDWGSTLFASAVVVAIDLVAGRIRFASAGHLPILLARGGEAQFLERPNAPLLGIPFPVRVPEYEADIQPGDELLLYTDGLVERRTASIDAGLRRLAEAVRSVGHLPTAAAGDRILAELLDQDEHDDDVCLLLCRWTGVPAEEAVPVG